MSFGFGVGKTIKPQKRETTFGFSASKEEDARREEEKIKKVRIHELPDFLGGGAFKTADEGGLFLTKRGYGGIETSEGKDRHHIAPVSLGGISEARNIRVLPEEDHAVITKVGNAAIRDFQAGRIGLQEARLINFTALQRLDDNLDEKSFFDKIADKAGFVENIANFWDNIRGEKEEEFGIEEFKKSRAGKDIEALRETSTISAGKRPIFEAAEFTKEGVRAGRLQIPETAPWQLRILNPVYNIPAESLARVANATEKFLFQGEGTKAKKAAKAVDLVTSSLGLIPAWLMLSTGLAAAEEVPIIKYPARVINAGFGKVGELGGAGAVSLLESTSLSDEAKKELRKPIEEVGALIAQLATGHTMGKVTTKAAKSEPVVKATSALKDTAIRVGESMESKVKQEINRGIIITPEIAKRIADDTIANIKKEVKLERKREIAEKKVIPEPQEVVPKRRPEREKAATRLLDELNRAPAESVSKQFIRDQIARAETPKAIRKTFDRILEEFEGRIKKAEFDRRVREELIPKVEPTKILEPLLAEARKFETVEEFITAQRIAAGDAVKPPVELTEIFTRAKEVKPEKLPVEPAKAKEVRPTKVEPEKVPTPEEGVPDFKTQIKERGLSKGVEAKAVEAKITEGFEGLPQYETVNLKEQAKKANELLEANMGDSINIAMGEKTPPKGLLPEMVFVAVENFALKTRNVELLQRLAQSRLAGEATTMGQRIRALGERDPSSPVKIMSDVSESRKTAAKKKVGQTKRTVESIKKEIKKKAPKKEAWNDFIDSITC